MRLTFLLSSALLLRAAVAQKGPLQEEHSEEQLQWKTMSKNEVDKLHLMQEIDANLVAQLLSNAKEDATGASASRAMRAQSHGKRKSHKRGVRQLSNSRHLDGGDVTAMLDTMWLMICGTFVFFMHAGFAMLEAGTARSKNVQAIMIKNLITVCMGTLGWYFLGWSLAYGGNTKTVDSWKDGTFEECPPEDNPMGCPDDYADNGFIGGHNQYAGSGFLGKGKAVDKLWAEGIIKPVENGGGQAYMWFFQWAFCTAGASIVSGGIAERVKFPGYMFFSFCMSAFIYPVVVCSTWGYGWLETFHKDKDGNPIGGYIDFAGSGVVHLCGGIGALVGAIVVGSRTGRFDPALEEEFQPHSFPLIVLGTFILWFGWCGFNSGSTLGLSDSTTALVAAHVMMNTTISAATGGYTTVVVQRLLTGKWDLAGLCNGILAGLVSITAGCSNVESGSAVLIGFLGGCLVVASSRLIKKVKIDDPVDAFSVHGACGIWGCLAAALFDFGAGTDKHHGWGGFSATSWTEDGETKYMTTGDALAANLCEILFVISWSGGLSLIIFGGLLKAGVLRVEEEKETLGCDSECASPGAYNIKSINDSSPSLRGSLWEPNKAEVKAEVPTVVPTDVLKESETKESDGHVLTNGKANSEETGLNENGVTLEDASTDPGPDDRITRNSDESTDILSPSLLSLEQFVGKMSSSDLRKASKGVSSPDVKVKR